MRYHVLMTSVDAAPPASRTEFVLERIRRAILGGRLKPGQALVESELARSFGVSKTPVREALKTLAGSGLVDMSQYKGVSVRTVDAGMARSVSDLRSLLEPEAVRRAVVAGAGTTDAHAALDEAEKSARADDRAAMSLANRAFHRVLYRDCGNPLLVRILDDLSDQVALVSVAGWKVNPTWQEESVEHRGILDAFDAGEGERAATLLRAHIDGFADRAMRGLSDDPP